MTSASPAILSSYGSLLIGELGQPLFPDLILSLIDC